MLLTNKIWFIVLSVLLVVLFAVDVSVGSVIVSPRYLFEPMIEGDMESMVNHHILFDLRLPKAITAVLAGSALSVTGLMMQTLFRNPLAGPYILGVSSGATLGVALITMCSTLLAMPLAGGSAGVLTSAILGSTLTLLLVLLLARRVKSSVSLLIVGMMIGSVAGALVNVLQNFSNPDALKLFIVWTLGSLSSVGWSQMGWLLAVFVVGMVLSVCMIKPLNGLILGENYAGGLGINVQLTRILLVLSTGLLAGGITAFCGPIAFIGVAVPHLARGLNKTSDHLITMPSAALIGADMLLVCDAISSCFAHPLPISTVSALFGAPIIIWIILKR